MAPLCSRALTAQEILDLADVLVVTRPPAATDASSDTLELLLLITAQGEVTAFNGHVDLGTGIRTALAQIVAEELDAPLEAVTMILGDTARTPNQGATIASDTIQNSAMPLKLAAAQARAFLLAKAAAVLGLPQDNLRVEDGVVRGDEDGAQIDYGALIKGGRHHLMLSETVTFKDPVQYRIIGRSTPRVDIPDKATGKLTYVHDMRVPGMLHGRVVRPPYSGLDSGDFVGASLLGVDRDSIRHVQGVVAVVVIGDFIGIVAEREEQAVQAAQAVHANWRPIPTPTDLTDLAGALRANPSRPRMLLDKGDVDAAIAGAAKTLRREYLWPYQMHGSIGPSCAVADYGPDRLVVWAGTQNPHILRADLAKLLDLPEQGVEIIRMEAAGCYGRNCADDVAADASLLSRAVGRPVRVQLSREQEHVWEPKGAGQLMEVQGGLDAAGDAVAYDFATRYPSNGAPLLAALLTGKTPPVPAVFEMGDRTSIAPYDYPNMRVVVHDMAPIVRASWLRGVSALPNTFAHESYIDELAAEAGVDPVEYRLRYLKDPRAIELVRAVAERANWIAHTSAGALGGDGDILRGRGFAYALYVHSKFPGYGAAWAAWVADVEVNRSTGEVHVTKVTVGHDAGLMINPDGVRHQIEGNVIQSTSRVLKEEVRFEGGLVASQEWGSYPILSFPELPTIDVLMIPRPDQPPLGAGESASVPSAAAIANAVYDATGVRFRELPLTPERVKAGLARADGGPPPKPRRRGWTWALFGALAGVAAFSATVTPWRPRIEPIARPDMGIYSLETIARGRLLAEIGDCAVCHTAKGGAPNAGGFALETPFGVVYSTNITPDEATGIGAWSYPAFERAMRQGVHRDGRHLYPAFPYTAFAKVTDADLQALYAYLMSQPAVTAKVPTTRLAFPFGLRPLLAGWNLLFHRPAVFSPKANHTAEWNRGAYLVEGLGHCGACHSPRNILGAERSGKASFGGGWAEGWEAPALNELARAPVPWTRQALFDYLRTGRSNEHSGALGPMAPVIHGLTNLPDVDVWAMATYIASFSEATAQRHDESAAERLSQAAQVRVLPASPGQRLYESACASCHESGRLRLDAPPVSLALNTNLHSAGPSNVIRVVLEGSHPSIPSGLESMPAFSSLSDRQLAELVAYLRSRFAPTQPAWPSLEAEIGRVRGHTSGG